MKLELPEKQKLGVLAKTLPLALLIVSLGASVSMWWALDRKFKDEAEHYFVDICDNFTNRVVRRLHNHEQALLGCAGLFTASDRVTREEWRRYVAALKLDQNIPGVMGIAFALWLPDAEKAANIAKIRAEGFEEYRIHPAGGRPFYAPIIYIEPFDWRNQRAFGYDVYSDHARRAALDKAKSSGQTSIAPRVKFIQDEEGEDAGSGLVMFIPVYQLGNPLDTPELRREALKGFICGPVRFSDFIYGIFKKLPQDVSFEIYAGGKADQDALLFDSVKTERLRVPPDFKPLFSKDILVNDYGCAFLFRFKSLPAFARGIDRHSSYAILGLCVLASLLLTTLAYLSLNIGRKELDIAGKNFDAFFNTVEDLLFALDLNGRIIHMNDTAVGRLGYSADELVGLPVYSLYPLERQEEARRIIGGMLDSKSGFCQIPVLAKDRRAIPAETRVIRGEWNGGPALFCVMKDISLRLISEARFTSAFQLSSVLMSISTVEEGVFLNTNEAFLKTMGFSYDEVIGKSVTDLGIYENLADRAKIKNIFLKEGKLENQEVELRKKDGTPVPTLFSATHIHVEERKCWLVSMVDVSKLKKVEAMLRESEERIRLIMDSTGEGIYGIGLDGRCSFRNKACLRLLGYSEDNDILGRNIHDLIHYKNIDGAPTPFEKCKIHNAFKNGFEAHSDEEVFWRADGSCFPVEYWSYPQFRDGMLAGAVVTFFDISDKKETKRQIERSLKEKETLLREIHHRVKNNMAVISSLLALQEYASEDASAKKMLEESQRRIKSMALVHEKLYRSNDLTSIDFGDYITTIVTEVSSAYLKGPRSIRTEIDAESLFLDIDLAIPCGLVLNELLTNAFKYAFEGRDEGDLRVHFSKTASSFLMIVKDDGVGLPDGFDPAKSSSMGLQIVDALVRQMKGRIRFESTPGKGVSAIVDFPGKGEPT